MARAKKSGAAHAKKAGTPPSSPAADSGLTEVKSAAKGRKKKAAAEEGSPPAPSDRAPAKKKTSVPPPPAREPRTRQSPWPTTAWLAENHDVAAAQDLMLMAYWIADQLGDAALPEARRTALRAAVHAAGPLLRGAADGVATFLVTAAVQRNGSIMAQAQRSERERLPAGGTLDALLEAHEDEAVHATLRQVRLHSADVASWLEELERRGRAELRNALRAAASDGEAGTENEALRRLLALVLFATGRRTKPPGS